MNKIAPTTRAEINASVVSQGMWVRENFTNWEYAQVYPAQFTRNAMLKGNEEGGKKNGKVDNKLDDGYFLTVGYSH